MCSTPTARPPCSPGHPSGPHMLSPFLPATPSPRHLARRSSTKHSQIHLEIHDEPMCQHRAGAQSLLPLERKAGPRQHLR